MCKTILKVRNLIIILWISLEKGEYFDFNHFLGCIYPTLYIITRFLGQAYHFSLLICYPCSFYFHALILVSLWKWKLPPLNGTGKDQKLITNFDKTMTFSAARWFDLSLGVKTPLITTFMAINWLGSSGKDCFDMLKSIGFVDLAWLFSSLRRSDRLYLGWFVWDLLERQFKMQSSRWSVKAH